MSITFEEKLQRSVEIESYDTEDPLVLRELVGSSSLDVGGYLMNKEGAQDLIEVLQFYVNNGELPARKFGGELHLMDPKGKPLGASDPV